MNDPAGTGGRPPRRRARARGNSFGSLLAQLAHALLARACARLPLVLVNRIITCCGLVALVSPLLLWISWSKTGFFIIIAIAGTAVGIIHLLVWLYPEDPF